MRLRLILPQEILIDQQVRKVTVEASEGYVTLLPRHIDYVTELAPGLLAFVTPEDREEFVAVDEGILVKCEDEVLVASRNAVRGPDLGKLRQAVTDQFSRLDERERMSRDALARLEADFVRRFMELGK
ncbi:F0F1 ATP synthase subunit epsilon [bacterium]|nr:F0F1 ATP synthase subunit epsilon [bacterium]